MMETLVYFLAFVVVVYSQEPEPCVAPAEWYGERILVDSSKSYEERARIYYDKNNERVRMTEVVDHGKDEGYYDVLMLHKEGKEYRVNLRNKTCNVTKLDFPFRPIGVPDESKFMFESVYGIASIPFEYITAVTYFGERLIDRIKYTTTVTFASCIPVNDIYFNDKTGFIQSQYLNINITKLPEQVFDPSPLCTSL